MVFFEYTNLALSAPANGGLIGLSRGKTTRDTALKYKYRAATLWRVIQHDTGYLCVKCSYVILNHTTQI
jgi:hypothetical protein